MFYVYTMISVIVILAIIIVCSVTDILFQYGRVKTKVLNMNLRYHKSCPSIAAFEQCPECVVNFIKNSTVNFNSVLLDGMELIFVENLTDNNGQTVEGKATIHSKFFGLYKIRIIFIDYYTAQNFTEVENLIRLFVHEYKHHWIQAKYGTMDCEHQKYYWY